MNAEKLMDAMNLLPDDLLEETDALRQKKRIPWKSLTALAACLCLAVGLWFALPGTKTADSAFDSAAENGAETENVKDGSGITAGEQQSSSTTGFIDVTVAEVCEDYITVTADMHEDISDRTPIEVSLKELEEIPQLETGQHIRLYLGIQSEESYEGTVLTPHKIEVLE